MPSIEQSLRSNLDLSGFAPHEPEPRPSPPVELPTTRSPFLRCPVPPLGTISIDNLDQFNVNGLIPQYRVFRS